MSITNQSKPSTSIINASKIASYETWDTITSTWDTETRTWDDTLSLMDNIARTSSTITNISKPA